MDKLPRTVEINSQMTELVKAMGREPNLVPACVAPAAAPLPRLRAMGGDRRVTTAGSRRDRPSRQAVAFAAADVHPLLCAVAHRTGDLSLLRPELAPDQAQMLMPGRGLGPEQEAEARALAADAWSPTPSWRRPSTS